MDIEDNVIGVKNRSRGKWVSGIQTNSLAAPMGGDTENRGAFPGEDGISEVRDHPAPVISSGVSMLHEDTVKNRYSFEESRNLSRVREYRAFYSLRCFAALASARRIHPPAFGRPPSLRGNLLTGILNM